MSLTLNVNHGQQISACTLNDSRVKRMMSGNHDTAVHMGLWDRFKDWFRIEKKAEALENLYKLLYPTPEDTEVSGLLALLIITKARSIRLLFMHSVSSKH